MLANIEHYYQEIGRQVLELNLPVVGKLLVYAEVSDGVISADVFYEKEDGEVGFRFGNQVLRDTIYSFWLMWKGVPGNAEWRCMSYLISDGKFEIEFSYPSQINENERLSDRRPLVVSKHFGNARVDYKNPGA